MNIECRKHYSQFSNNEEKTLKKLISEKEYILTDYSIMRKTHRVILNREIRDTLKDYKIIEYHYKFGDNRVLIRSNKSYNHYNICLVLSLNEGKIITVYDNYDNDKHYTLNITNYNGNLDIRRIIKN